MAQKEYHRKKLFDFHMNDLREICPKASSVFVCPICLNIYSEDAVINNKLNVGHVWNREFVRQHTSSKKAIHQQILLCQICNSRSGGRGENTLIEFETFRRTKEAGQFHKPRIQVLSKEFSDPAVINSIPIKIKEDEIGAKIFFEKSEETGYPLYNPKERQLIEKYFAQGRCSIIVEETYPFRERWLPTQAVLLTSAYLLMFYSFGYKFIFHTYLDPVREYILESFIGNLDNRLDLEEEKTMSVRLCSKHFNKEPEIDFFPETELSPHHIEISFLDYHIRLPYKHTFIIQEETHPLPDGLRGISIRASDHRIHSGFCNYDTLLGDVDYCIEGNSLIQLSR